MQEDTQNKIKQATSEMLGDTSTWPGGVLCLRRFPADPGGFPECGFVAEGNPLKVIIGNIWGFIDGEPPEGIVNYLSIEDMVEAGWEVD